MPAPIFSMLPEKAALMGELEKAHSDLLGWAEKVEAAEKEAVRCLDGLAGDPESAHGFANQYLVDFLKNAGFTRVAEAYERAEKRVGFWYA